MNQERTVNIKTECKNCEFCTDNQHCRLKRLEVYLENNLAQLNDDGYTILTVCNTFRKRGFITECGGELKAMELLQKEIQIQTDFIILAIECNVTQVLQSVKDCHKQTIQPTRIIILVQAKQFDYNSLQECLNDISDIPYIIIKVMREDANLADCIDIAVKRCSSMYYTLWEAGHEIPVDYLARLNKLMNEDLKKFNMVQYNDQVIDGLTIQTNLHKILNGNINAWIGEKIKYLANQQNKTEMIIKYE